MAETLGVTELTLSKLAKAGVLIRKPDPDRRRAYFYLYEENIRRFIKRIQEPAVEAQRVYALARARTEEHKALKVALEVEIKRGALVPADKFVRELGGKLSVFKQRLSAIPGRVAASYSETENERRVLELALKEEINSSLIALADILAHGQTEQRNGSSHLGPTG